MGATSSSSFGGAPNSSYASNFTFPTVQNAGYFGGGSDGTNTLASIGKVDYANDTATASVRSALSVERTDSGATGNSNFGYFGGGSVFAVGFFFFAMAGLLLWVTVGLMKFNETARVGMIILAGLQLVIPFLFAGMNILAIEILVFNPIGLVVLFINLLRIYALAFDKNTIALFGDMTYPT